MLYSIIVGIIAYYAILFSVGVLVNAAAIEGSLVAFAAICFIGAYLARSSRLVCRLACWLGGISTTFVLARWILLPIIQGNGNVWVILIAFFAGFACYLATRLFWYRKYAKRDKKDHKRPAPPLGKEWARWLIVIVA